MSSISYFKLLYNRSVSLRYLLYEMIVKFFFVIFVGRELVPVAVALSPAVENMK